MELLFSKEMYDNLKIVDMISKPLAILTLHENNETIFKLFDKTNSWYLRLIENKKYIGMLSKSKFLQKYLNLNVDFSVC